MNNGISAEKIKAKPMSFWFDADGALKPSAEEYVSVRPEVCLGTDFDGSWPEEWEVA